MVLLTVATTRLLTGSEADMAEYTHRRPIEAGWSADAPVAAEAIQRHFEAWQVPLVSVTWRANPPEYVIVAGAALTDEQMQHQGLESV